MEVIFAKEATEHDKAIVRWLATVHGVTHTDASKNCMFFFTGLSCQLFRAAPAGLEERILRLRNVETIIVHHVTDAQLHAAEKHMKSLHSSGSY